MMVLGLTELVRLLCRFVFTLKPREIELVFFLSFLGNQSSPPPAPLVTNKLWTTSDLEVSFFFPFIPQQVFRWVPSIPKSLTLI